MKKRKEPPTPPPSKWVFRSQAERVAECRLVCKQQGLDRRQTTTMVNMVKRLYADTLKVNARLEDLQKRITSATYDNKEKYDGGFFIKDAKGPRK